MKKKIIISIILVVIIATGVSLTLIGKNQATKIDSKISKVAKVDFTGKTQIDDVRKDYDKSLFTAKWFVKKLDILEKAEARIKKDQDKIDKVEKLIDKIGYDSKKEDCNITLKSANKISDAQMAYQKLNELLQKGVKNYDKLKKSNEILSGLLAISDVETAIDGIGEVSLDKKEVITLARAGYTNLNNEKLQKKVKNIKTLEDAEKRLAELEAEAQKQASKSGGKTSSGSRGNSGRGSGSSGGNSNLDYSGGSSGGNGMTYGNHQPPAGYSSWEEYDRANGITIGF